MTLYGSENLADVMAFAIEMAKATGHRHKVQRSRGRSKPGRTVWIIRPTDLRDVPPKARI